MVHWFLKCMATIGDGALRSLENIISFYDSAKGEKSLRIISVHDDGKEAYQIYTSTGGKITLYCIERVYELQYSSWWCKNEIHKTYRVRGTSDGNVPEDLAAMIGTGITIGAMLPNILPREKQKKHAIHLYASYLVNELEKETKN